MRVGIATDHGGFGLKEDLVARLHAAGHEVTDFGADTLISNHTNLDGSKAKMPALAMRKPGDPNPYVIGPAAVQGYLTVASECAKAVLAGMTP